MALIVESSPRGINGSYLAEKLASKYGGVDVLRLKDISFSGCKACGECRKNDSLCVLKDDLSYWLEKLEHEKQIILISPNYFGFVNGEMKMFTDRFYCMRKANKNTRFAEGAKLVFIVTQGSPNRSAGDRALEWMKAVVERYSIKFYGHVIPNCQDNTDGVRLKEEEVMMNISFFF